MLTFKRNAVYIYRWSVQKEGVEVATLSRYGMMPRPYTSTVRGECATHKTMSDAQDYLNCRFRNA